jgi:hypothetical protein
MLLFMMFFSRLCKVHLVVSTVLLLEVIIGGLVALWQSVVVLVVEQRMVAIAPWEFLFKSKPKEKAD